MPGTRRRRRRFHRGLLRNGPGPHHESTPGIEIPVWEQSSSGRAVADSALLEVRMRLFPIAGAASTFKSEWLWADPRRGCELTMDSRRLVGIRLRKES